MVQPHTDQKQPEISTLSENLFHASEVFVSHFHFHLAARSVDDSPSLQDVS